MATSLSTGINTEADAQARLQMWLDCEQAIGQGAQSYSIGDRQLTRADMDTVRASIAYWQRQVRAFQRVASGGRGTPHKVVKWLG